MTSQFLWVRHVGRSLVPLLGRFDGQEALPNWPTPVPGKLLLVPVGRGVSPYSHEPRIRALECSLRRWLVFFSVSDQREQAASQKSHVIISAGSSQLHRPAFGSQKTWALGAEGH